MGLQTRRGTAYTASVGWILSPGPESSPAHSTGPVANEPNPPAAGHPAPESDPFVFRPDDAKGQTWGRLQRAKDLSRQGADPATQSRLSSRKPERLGASNRDARDYKSCCLIRSRLKLEDKFLEEEGSGTVNNVKGSSAQAPADRARPPCEQGARELA